MANSADSEKPTDLDLQRQGISGYSRSRVKTTFGTVSEVVLILNIVDSKCPKIPNTLFHTFWAKLLLLCNSCFFKFLVGWQTV